MTEERKVQLGVSVDATGAKEGFDQVKREAQSMAQAVGQAGQQAGKAIDGMGSGGAQSAQKVDAATKSMIQSIQRTTAVMEAGSKTSSKYYEVLAAQRGVPVDTLKPYLAQLDAIKDKQAAANQALNATNPAMQKIGISAAQTAAAMRQVPAQFTDIITSLQAGQAPMTVLLQQGGQLKDVFGGIGPAAKALGGYMLGLVNPFTLAAAGAGVLAYAYSQGSKEADAYRKALILTGNAAGTTANQLADMAAKVGKSVGTQGEAAAALAEMAGTGRIAAGNLEYFSRVAIQMEKTVGKSAAETAKDLADLGKSPLAASEKLNEQYHYLTASVYAQIKALQDQGKEEEAGVIAQRAYTSAFDDRTKEVVANLGLIEQGWKHVVTEAKKGWDEILGIGRTKTPTEKAASVGDQIAAMRKQITISGEGGRASLASKSTFGDDLQALLEQQAALQENARLERRLGEATAASVRQNEARIAWDKEGDKYLSRRAQMEREINAERNKGSEAGASQVEIEKRIGDIRKKYSDIFNDGVDSQIEAIKRLGQVQELVAKRGIDQVSADRSANLLSEKAAIEQIAELELKAFGREKDRLQAELDLTKQKQNSLKEQAALRGQIEQNDANGVSRQMKLTSDLFVLQAKMESEVFDQILKSTAARNDANDALALEYSLYGKSADAREIAMVAIREEATLERYIMEQRRVGKPLSEEMINQLRAEKDKRVEVTQATMGQLKALAYVHQLEMENKKFAADSIADEMSRSAAILAIDAEEWRKRIDAAEEGTKARKMLEDQFDQWYANRQMAPVLDRWKSIITNLDNDFREGFREMLSNGQGAWKSFSKSLGNTLKTALADALYQTFAKRYVVNIVSSLAGAISGPAVGNALAGSSSGLMQGSSLINAGSTLYNGYTGLSSFGNTIGQVAQYGSTLAAGGTTAVSTGAAGTGWVSAEGGAGYLSEGAATFGKTLATAAPYLAAAAAIYSIAKSLDDSGTIHTGGGASTNQWGTTSSLDARSLGFMQIDSSAETGRMVSGITSSIVNILNGTATTFGKEAGYSAATAFADDTSKDGAWGALLISKAGKDLVNWDANRQSRWAPREFADGEAGRNQYLAELSKSVRTALDDIGLPGWAQGMLNQLGDAPSITDLGAVVDKINATQTALVNMGNAIGGIKSLSDSAVTALINASGGVDALASAASSYYDGYYSEAEKLANTSKQVSDALAKVGLQMPATRDEFRDLVDANLALGEAGAPTVATLLKVAGAFGTVADAAEQVAQKAKQGALDNVQNAFSAVQRSVDAERKTITQAYNDAIAPVQKRISDITDSVSKLSSLSSTLRSTVNGMRLESQLGTDRAAAQAQIMSALAIAKAGGAFPEADALQSALQVVSQPSEQLYKTFIDYQRDFLVTKNNIAELADLTDAQLTDSQRMQKTLEEQLKTAELGYNAEMSRLDGILSSAQTQIDVLKGIDASVKSEAAALAGFKATVSGAVTAGANGGGVNSATFGGAGYGSAGGYGGASNGQGATDKLSAVESLYAKYSDLSYLTPSGGAFWADQFNKGIPLSQIEQTFQDSVKAVRGYATGGEHMGGLRIVGENGPELEATGPSRIWNASQTREFLGGGNNADVANEIRALRDEVARLRNEAEKSAISNRKVADLLTRVTQDGNSLLTTPA